MNFFPMKDICFYFIIGLLVFPPPLLAKDRIQLKDGLLVEGKVLKSKKLIRNDQQTQKVLSESPSSSFYDQNLFYMDLDPSYIMTPRFSLGIGYERMLLSTYKINICFAIESFLGYEKLYNDYNQESFQEIYYYRMLQIVARFSYDYWKKEKAASDAYKFKGFFTDFYFGYYKNEIKLEESDMEEDNINQVDLSGKRTINGYHSGFGMGYRGKVNRNAPVYFSLGVSYIFPLPDSPQKVAIAYKKEDNSTSENNSTKIKFYGIPRFYIRLGYFF